MTGRRSLWIALAVGALAIVAALGIRWRRASVAPPTVPDAMADMPGMSGASAGGAAGEVRLTSEQVRQFGVTFGTVEERELSTAVRATGAVTIDESRVTTVAPRFGGYVEQLLVRTTGAPVRRGQPLARLYAPDVLAVEEELLVARRLVTTLGTSAVPGVPAPSTDLVAAARRRLALLGVDDAEIDAVLRGGRASRTVTLRAPASGIVIEKRVTDGQAVGAGEPLYTLADLGVVWIEVELREADAASVRAGTSAQVELAAYPGRPLAGTVAYVYPTLVAASRTLRARVVVPNGDGRLRPGMYATVRLASPSRRALTVPASAVVRTGERSLVFVDLGGGRLAPRDVETGRTTSDVVEVLAGLTPGQRVVTSAQYLLESESNLADVMRSMIGQTGAQDMGAMPDAPGMESMPGMQTKGADTRGLPPAAAPTRPNAPR
jgi:Cu(I)/Ag(I) efflux system membrane fusion protein